MGIGRYTARPLTPADGERLRPFDPTGDLTAALGVHNEGVGVWDGDDLVAVSMWRVYGDEWASTHIEVAPAYRRQGIATKLKKGLVMRARAAGAHRVRSMIAFDNDPMIELNSKLKARIAWDRPVLGKPQWVTAIIDLR